MKICLVVINRDLIWKYKPIDVPKETNIKFASHRQRMNEIEQSLFSLNYTFLSEVHRRSPIKQEYKFFRLNFYLFCINHVLFIGILVIISLRNSDSFIFFIWCGINIVNFEIGLNLKNVIIQLLVDLFKVLCIIGDQWFKVDDHGTVLWKVGFEALRDIKCCISNEKNEILLSSFLVITCRCQV